MSDLILVVVAGMPATTFPGYKTFYGLCTNLAIAIPDLSVVFTEDPEFDQKIINCSAKVALCLGDRATAVLTGHSTYFSKLCSYVLFPVDCLPIETKVYEQVGIYKTSKKILGGGWKYIKGDPRYGWRAKTSIRALNPNLRWIIPTFDPVKVQRQKLSPRPAFKADILRARRFRDGEEPLAIPDIHLAPLPASVLTLDIETIGLGPSIVQIGLATDMSTRSIAWNFDARAQTQEAINSSQVVQGHNLAFDIPRLEADGVSMEGRQRFDTMLAAALLYPDMPKALERVAPFNLDIQPWKHLSLTNPTIYNALDAYYTHEIAKKQRIELEKTGMTSLFTHTIMPATETLIEMSRIGLKIDQDRLFKWQTELAAKVQVLAKQWSEISGGVNAFSYGQVSNYLYRKLALAPQYADISETEGGERGVLRLSTNESSLRDLIGLYSEHTPLLSVLIDLKKSRKLLNTYAKAEIAEDGCVHPSYLPSSKDVSTGSSSTGRIASSHPNIQNQTPESKLLYIPHRPGWKFVEFDFSQIELRIAATLSDDQTLQTALEGDVHAHTMDLVGCDRTRAKNILYGSLYGAGPRKLARLLRAKGVQTTQSECFALQSALARAYPRLWAWRSAVAAEGGARRFLTNPFGRRRYFYGGTASIPEMYDYLPQSTAADILINLLIPLNRWAQRSGGWFLTTTHDSGLFEFPEEMLTDKLFDGLRQICGTEWGQVGPGFRVPIVIKTGPNWGMMEEMKC